jgi:hypothetical protein
VRKPLTIVVAAGPVGRVLATARTRTSVEHGEPAAVKALVGKVKGKDIAKDKLR